MGCMNTVKTWTISCKKLEDTLNLGKKLGLRCRGGECFELIADLGGGKTAFVRGLASGMGTGDDVSSPSFTINNTYAGASLTLEHYDFYRLSEAGIVAGELTEDINSPGVVVAVEWGDIVHDVLPTARITVSIQSQLDDSRDFEFVWPAEYDYLFEELDI
jgi:tRNA threonylcarbamoyladenosine biosynthesis protein TsaE